MRLFGFVIRRYDPERVQDLWDKFDRFEKQTWQVAINAATDPPSDVRQRDREGWTKLRLEIVRGIHDLGSGR